MFGFMSKKLVLPKAEEALAGRPDPIATSSQHFVLGTPLKGPYPDQYCQILFGMGCFWGAERLFWQLDGVYTTAVGYSAGHTPNPTYEEVCSGQTGHNEVVLVIYDPARLSLSTLLTHFWEGHDPTQGMRQGNDLGTQYRSGIYTSDAVQQREAEASRDAYGSVLAARGLGPISTEIRAATDFYFAEGYHQQYLARNPNGYCGLGGLGITCPTGL